MFLSKNKQSYCYTQLGNYKEEYVFKRIRNPLDFLMGCNLSFTRSLNTSYLKIDG